MALLAGEQHAREAYPDLEIECKVKATPIYTLETQTEDKDRGITALNAGLESNILAYHYFFTHSSLPLIPPPPPPPSSFFSLE